MIVWHFRQELGRPVHAKTFPRGRRAAWFTQPLDCAARDLASFPGFFALRRVTGEVLHCAERMAGGRAAHSFPNIVATIAGYWLQDQSAEIWRPRQYLQSGNPARPKAPCTASGRPPFAL